VSIMRAAAALRRSYNQTLRLVLVGELRGEQDDRGRWWIDADDLARYLREHSRPQAAAVA
jgi:hypothetical protein